MVRAVHDRGWSGPIANVAHAAGLMMGLIAGLPAYVLYPAGARGQPGVQGAQLGRCHIRGKTRVYRQFVAPYVPLWLLVIAAAAIFLD
jgi:hypothetical protein